MKWKIQDVTISYEDIKTTDFIYMEDHNNWPERKYVGNKDKVVCSYLRGEFNPTQVVVAYAIHPSGRRVKLDGHSRSRAIREGLLTNAPTHLHAVVYKTTTTGMFNNLLTHFDNKWAGNNHHIVDIIYSEQTMNIDSPALQRPTSAIKFAKYGNSSKALTDDDRRELFAEFRQELLWMESLELDKRVHGDRMITAITLGVAFAILKKHRAKGLDIIDDFFNRSARYDFKDLYAYIDNKDNVVSGGAVERTLYKDWLAVFEQKI